MPNKQPKEPIDIKQEFAERLKWAMQQAGYGDLSIKKKATVMGISKGFMQGLLDGEKMPSRKNSLRFAALLGVRETWLMEGTLPIREELTNEIAIGHWATEDKEALLTIWRSIESKYNTQKDN